MTDLNNIRKIIVKGLKDYLNISVIRSNQIGAAPKYPYASYTITTPIAIKNGTWGVYDDAKMRKPFTSTFSFTVQSDNESEVLELVTKAHTWFDYVGILYLKDNNIIVQSVGNINNRDNMITIEYESRSGFDVVFWLLNEINNNETEFIETAKINFEDK